MATAHHIMSIPSFMHMLLAAVTCGTDYACTSSTDTVLEDAVCSSSTCTDDECCEPTEPGERGALCFLTLLNISVLWDSAIRIGWYQLRFMICKHSFTSCRSSRLHFTPFYGTCSRSHSSDVRRGLRLCFLDGYGGGGCVLPLRHMHRR